MCWSLKTNWITKIPQSPNGLVLTSICIMCSCDHHHQQGNHHGYPCIVRSCDCNGALRWPFKLPAVAWSCNLLYNNRSWPQHDEKCVLYLRKEHIFFLELTICSRTGLVWKNLFIPKVHCIANFLATGCDKLYFWLTKSTSFHEEITWEISL